MTSPTTTGAKAAKSRPPPTFETEIIVEKKDKKEKKESETDAEVDMGLVMRLQNRLEQQYANGILNFRTIRNPIAELDMGLL